MDFLTKAGPLIWPIILCSVIGLGIFLDRTYVLLRIGSGQAELVSRLVALARGGDVDKVIALTRETRGPITNVLGTLLDNLGLPENKRDQIVELSGNRELRRAQSGLRGLAVIARVAPLLGLLGTVVGLVEAFIAVSTMQGPPNPAVLANGIWQALLTTVAGLIVAIPAILSHEWLQSRVNQLAFAMQESVTEMLAAVGMPASAKKASGDADA
jgi:biopolymer transport protein ExbB